MSSRPAPANPRSVKRVRPAAMSAARVCARRAVGATAGVAAGRLEGLGSPEATKREVDERAGRSPAELADECAEVTKTAAGMLPLFDDAAWAGASPGGYEGTLGDGVEALW